MKYKAFISYSHAADDALAPALQSALHAFARPWSSMRAIHVFRDKTSLAASPELWPAIEQALSESEYLLLMASPASAASHWVGREIDWWFVNRPKGTLFILLTDGELAWDEEAKDFDWSRTSALPRASLTGRFGGEPLWVDLRWARSDETLSLRHTRFRSAVLDIAAPLHGKDKDALDGEDVQAFTRLQRVRRTVATGLTLLAIATAAAVTIALRERSEAARQGNVAQASRLAVQADLEREAGAAVDESVMLASEALSMLAPIGVRTLETDLSMRRALALLPEVLNEILHFGDGVRLNADGSRMFVLRSGQQVEQLDSRDGTARSCDKSAMDSLLRLESGATPLRLVRAISDDGNWCVLQQFDSTLVNTLQLWRASPLERVAALRLRSQSGHLDPAVSADGALIATTDRPQLGGDSGAVLRLWSRRRNAEILLRRGSAFRGFSPDSVHFATTDGLYRLSSDDGSPARIVAWEVDSVERIFTGDIVFSRSGAFVATRADLSSEIRVVSVQSGAEVHSAEAPLGRLLALRDDGLMVVLSSGHSVLVSTSDGEVMARLPQEASAAAFGSDDPTLLVGDTIGPVFGTRVLKMMAFADAVRGKDLPANDAAQHLAIDSGVVRIVTLSKSALHVRAWREDGSAWSEASRQDLPRAFVISADGRFLLSARGLRLSLSRLDGSLPARVISTVDSARVLGTSRDGLHIAAWFGDSIHVWVGTAPSPVSVPLSAAPARLHVSSDGRYLVALVIDRLTPSRVGPLHTLHRWRLGASSDIVSMDLGRLQREVPSLCMVSDDAREVVLDGARRPFVSDRGGAGFSERDLTECDEGDASLRVERVGARVLVLDRATAQPVARLDHPRPVTHAAVSPDGKQLATVDEAGQVRVYLLDATEVVAQACARKPRPTARARELSAAIALRPSDACGRAWPPPARR